jgi:hypothetical protein
LKYLTLKLGKTKIELLVSKPNEYIKNEDDNVGIDKLVSIDYYLKVIKNKLDSYKEIKM